MPHTAKTSCHQRDNELRSLHHIMMEYCLNICNSQQWIKHEHEPSPSYSRRKSLIAQFPGGRNIFSRIILTILVPGPSSLCLWGVSIASLMFSNPSFLQLLRWVSPNLFSFFAASSHLTTVFNTSQPFQSPLSSNSLFSIEVFMQNILKTYSMQTMITCQCKISHCCQLASHW